MESENEMSSPFDGIPNRFPVGMFSYKEYALERVTAQRNQDYLACSAAIEIGNCPFSIVPDQECLVVHDDGTATVVAPLGFPMEHDVEGEVRVAYIGDLILGYLQADEYFMITQSSWGGMAAQEIEA